jgi:signal transduction histidine kinase
VALVVVTSAALGGLAASGVAIFAVDRLLSEHADQRLRAATVTLAGELDEDSGEKQGDSVRATVADENSEILTSGIRLSVFERGRVLAGEEGVLPAPNACETSRTGTERWRACALPYGGWSLVAAQRRDERWLYWLYALSALGAVVLGAGAGALSSIRLSRWAVRPLEALSRSLSTWRPEASSALELAAPGDYEEVEAIRGALRDVAARLQTLLQQANRFAADAAHEIRTPLTALRAELELLAEESESTEREALTRACARVERLSGLVDRLLFLALPTEKLSEGFETLSVADLVEQIASELPETHRARLKLELSGEGLVRGDLALLRSAISNGLENAFKFAPDGPVLVRLEDARDVVLRIADAGPGVLPELRSRVFEAFYRGRQSAAPGHGLGLALIGHIACAHGGSAEFADTTSGAELVIRLPPWGQASSREIVR